MKLPQDLLTLGYLKTQRKICVGFPDTDYFYILY